MHLDDDNEAKCLFIKTKTKKTNAREVDGTLCRPRRTRPRPWVKIPSSGPKKRKQRNSLPELQGPIPVPGQPPGWKWGPIRGGPGVLWVWESPHARSHACGVQVVYLRTIPKSRKRIFGVTAPCVSVLLGFRDKRPAKGRRLRRRI